MSEIFQELNDSNAEDNRSKLILYLKDKITQLNGDIAEAVAAAYEIAGLMSTDYGQSLSSSDPIDEILTIAGELEINPNDAESLRKELIEKIQLIR